LEGDVRHTTKRHHTINPADSRHASGFVRPGISVAGMDKVDDKKATYESLIGYADGGSRDNPGQSAAGFVLIDTTALSFTRKGA